MGQFRGKAGSWVCLLAVLAMTGCTGGRSPGSDGGGSPASDAGPPAVSLLPGGAPSAGEMGLSLSSSSRPTEVIVEVVLGPHGNVYGVAGALTYDPAALELVSFTSTGRLEGASGLSAGKVNPPGRLLFVVTKQGRSTGTVVTQPLAVATLKLRPLRSGKSTLAFVPALSGVRDPDLEPAAPVTSYRGGELTIP